MLAWLHSMERVYEFFLFMKRKCTREDDYRDHCDGKLVAIHSGINNMKNKNMIHTIHTENTHKNALFLPLPQVLGNDKHMKLSSIGKL